MSWFGIALPPWRNKKIGAGAVTIRFVIKGRVPSKKNNQQAIAVRKEAYEYINDLFKDGVTAVTKPQVIAAVKKVHAKMRGNDQYKEFLEAQRPIIEAQRQVWVERLQDKGLIFPLSSASLNIRFYFSQRYRQDSVNKQQSIQDLLKDCYIIQDDDYTCINPITAEADCYYEEIKENLTFVSLSFRL